MCESKPECKMPAPYWILTNLPKSAPLVTHSAIGGPTHPDLSISTCARHLAREFRSLNAYAREYLAGPGKYVAYQWQGVAVKMATPNGGWS
jgi:hypothetical protein